VCDPRRVKGNGRAALSACVCRATSLLLAVVLLAAGACGPGPGSAAVKILPLGDSITDGRALPGAYRTALWHELTGAGARVDFVGSRLGGPDNLPDRDHEGHPGYRIDEIDADIVRWVNATYPGIVLIHLGTNDVVQDRDLAGAPARLAKLVDRVLAIAPDAEVFVASLIPLQDPAREARAVAFNAALPDLVRAKGPRVHYVDMHAALSVADLADGVHPGAAGYAKMAKAWAEALRPVLLRAG
jgi:lysophospholipase L1-like esterase